MDDLLAVVKTSKNGEKSHSLRAQTLSPNQETVPGLEINTSETALNVLKSVPSLPDVIRVLRFLDPVGPKKQSFNILVPSSISAQLLHLLISITIPDYWDKLPASYDENLDQEKNEFHARAALLRCLSSVAGITALVVRLRTLLDAEEFKNQATGKEHMLKNVLSVLVSVIKPQGLLFHLYKTNVQLSKNDAQNQVIWKEAISYIAVGKLLSIIAESLRSLGSVNISKSISWAGEGQRYATWLGRNISFMCCNVTMDDAPAWRAMGDFFGRSLSLGYAEIISGEVYTRLLLSDQPQKANFNSLFSNLRRHDQIMFFRSILYDLRKKYLPEPPDYTQISLNEPDINRAVSSVADLINFITENRDFLEVQTIQWLANGLAREVKGINLKRALITALSDKPDRIVDLFKKTLGLFGDQLYIKHTPIKAQEANMQVLLLSGGSIFQSTLPEFRNLVRTNSYLSSISNRLGASSPRARLFGMLVAMVLSNLLESPGKAIQFELDETEKAEFDFYRRLVQIHDCVGSMQSLKPIDPSTKWPSRPKQRLKNQARPVEMISIKKPTNESDDGLMSYEKPDSDPEDSEEDPTLITRSKPNAPVYIRDLVAYLRDSEHAESYHLGISNASVLIRRKASFGTEVAENAEELALVIICLQNKYNMSNFHELRLQGEIALLVAYPLTMGKWFSHTLFNADLSQDQRTTILIALGLAACELAGHGPADAESLGFELATTSGPAFASNRLPPSMEVIYGSGDISNSDPGSGGGLGLLDTLVTCRTASALRPVALQAADVATGPDALKVHTFSSRLEVERRRAERAERITAQRRRATGVGTTTTKDVYRVLADGLFYPLVSEFGLILHVSASRNTYNPFIHAPILRLFLQTITLILTTAGPFTPHLRPLARDALTLLVTLHTNPRVATDPLVLPALLALLLAVIDLVAAAGSVMEEWLVGDGSRDEVSGWMMELREWVVGVFEQAESSEGEDEVRMLAAGTLVRLGEITKRFQVRLFGIDAGFQY